jgi:acetyltransferase-like isoleucine patch superfamily enzyme
VDKIYYLQARRDSRHYISYLRRLGIEIGEDTIIYSPKTTTIDVTRPHLIEIGNNVRITGGVVILTHGADWHIVRN